MLEATVATKFVSERNIKFLLYEVFDVESLTKYEYYSEHNRKLFDMVLKAAVKLGRDLLFPVFEEMDRNQPELVNGEVKVHPSVKTIMKEFGEGGWISSRVPFDQDGEQLPNLVADICEFIKVFRCLWYPKSESTPTGILQQTMLSPPAYITNWGIVDARSFSSVSATKMTAADGWSESLTVV